MNQRRREKKIEKQEVIEAKKEEEKTAELEKKYKEVLREENRQREKTKREKREPPGAAREGDEGEGRGAQGEGEGEGQGVSQEERQVACWLNKHSPHRYNDAAKTISLLISLEPSSNFCACTLSPIAISAACTS